MISRPRQSTTSGDKDEIVRDQLIERTSNPKLRQRLLMEGSDLTLEKSLTIAETLESAEREARAMEGPSVPVPVQAVQRLSKPPRHGGQSGGPRQDLPPRPDIPQQLQQQQLKPPHLPRQQQQRHLPQRGQQQPRPGNTSQCWGCGRVGHRRGDQCCPAYNVKCSACGQLHHFRQHCVTMKRVVSSVQVLSVGVSPLTLDAQVEGKEVNFTVDSGSPVSILPRHLVRGELSVPSERLCTYGGSDLDVLGVKTVFVSYKGKSARVSVYVVPQGRALMGLDLMGVFDVNVVGNRICSVSTEPSQSDPVYEPISPAPEPVSPPACPPADSQEVQPAILGYQHRVTVDPGVPPVRQPLRRLPLSVVDEVSARLDELEEQGIIERVSASSWVSPLVVGRKRDGAIRLCVDMRKVNQAVITDGYPLPRIEDVLDRLGGSKVFSRLDLQDAYHQLELHPESRDLTTFVSHQGLYRFRRVNFGLASAGPCFQRVMSSMLEGIPGVEVYLDDVLVHADSQETHDARLEEVLDRFEAHRVRVNWPKSITSRRELTFLGYRVSADGVRIDPERVRPLLEAPDPHDEKSLRAFLGAVGYHARFLQSFADKVEPLRAALRAESFQWTSELSSVIHEVKEAIRRSLALGMFDPALRTVLSTDASDVGCGACVTQVDSTGTPRVIAYASKTFTAAERNYSVVEKESLACVWAVEKFRHYLWGRRFTLRTDHQALCTIFGPKGSNRVGRRVARWEARLLEYSFDVEYVRSDRNFVADGLSRLPVVETWWPDDDSIQIATLSVAAAVSEEEFRNASAADTELNAVRAYVIGRWPSRQRDVDPQAVRFYHVRDELSQHGSLLFRGDRLVVPAALRERVLRNAHEGHQGLVRTKQRLRARFWWPRLDRQVQEHLRGCEVCSQHDGHVRRERPPLQPIPLPDGPWQRLMIDVIGPMKGPQTERYGVVLCDMYSRWPEVALCQDATASTIISFLETVFCREGVPLELVSDNGPAFRSAELGHFLSQKGVKQTFSSPYSPQSCGMVERLNRTVKDAIQSARLAREPRAVFLRRFLAEYRTTPHPATGETPFLLMRGREARTVLDVSPGVSPASSGRASSSRDPAVRRRHRRYQSAYKSRYDRTSTAAPKWEAGDWVRVRQPVSGRIEGQQSVQIACRTGPVSYRLVTGERVHARRLVPGSVGGSEQVGECLDPVFETVALPSSTPADPTPSESSESPPSPRTPSPPPIPGPRRGSRERRAPVRFTPSR